MSFSLFILGFLFGLQHAFDVDHIAAMSVISSRAEKPLKSGMLWGLGHTVSLLIIAFLLYGFGLAIPKEFFVFFEKIVAVMLIALGAVSLKKFFETRKNHNGVILHNHPPMGSHTHRVSFFMGILHGLAGSAAIMILFISSLKSPILALAYIIIFGAGTILGMSLLTFCFGFVSKYFQKTVQFITSTISIAIGIIFIYRDIL